MTTSQQMESAVREEILRFQQGYMGSSPKVITVHFLDDLLVVRMESVLAPAYVKLIQSKPEGEGRIMIKSLRTQLVEATRGAMGLMIKRITGMEVVSMHHDISTRTGEEMVLFRLSGVPHFVDG